MENNFEVNFEAKLIRQEHRMVAVVLNFINFYLKRKNYEENDPRPKAAIVALVWKLFGPATVVAAGITIISIVTLIVAIQANRILIDSNKILSDQKLLQEASRRSALIFELTSIMNEIDEEMDEARVQKNALITRNSNDEAGILVGQDERPRRRDIENPPLYRLSDRLSGRITALSRSLKPYRFLDDNGIINETPYSPERGQLLLFLVNSGIDMEEMNHSPVIFDEADLNSADLEGIDLTHISLMKANLVNSKFGNTTLHYARLDNSDLTYANLSYAKLNWCSLSNSDLTNANLTAADLDGVDMNGVNFKNADLSYCNLSDIKSWNQISNIENAIISNVENAPDGFIDWAIENGAKL